MLFLNWDNQNIQQLKVSQGKTARPTLGKTAFLQNLKRKKKKKKARGTHFMEGRCRSTTSTAWTGLVLIGLSNSRGSGKVRPVSTSWSRCQLTRETNLIDTLKGRSFPPSPGKVTSKSTCWWEKSQLVKVLKEKYNYFQVSHIKIFKGKEGKYKKITNFNVKSIRLKCQ